MFFGVVDAAAGIAQVYRHAGLQPQLADQCNTSNEVLLLLSAKNTKQAVISKMHRGKAL